ncbi:hypothetical protein KVT40_005228 [Elsinoe batatas]|uniref:Uncharacterized protein n=1 Tax=Elsinoe batatas TaxID=2601811 RepID=A0A8K0L141_9PEZI|nr:hypothetical protein KVT40_005228 [Elsinoe batatas]
MWKQTSFVLGLTASVLAKYDSYILAPSSRTLHPVSTFGTINGTVSNADSLASSSPGSATFTDTSSVTYDFGKDIAGLVTLDIGETSADQFIGFTFSESSLWISSEGSDATQDAGIDEIIGFFPTGPGTYTSLEQSAQISSGLRSRWTPYGAPAPEASTAISPYIGGYEIQTHTLAGNVSASLDLIRLQWGFMLDDPRMTNSTFIEGYRNDGELKYAPYSNDPRISHSHGWATGPTSYLTFYVAGLQVVTAAGQTWRVAPQLGDLQRVDAGYQTPLGSFAAQTNATGDGGLSTDFSTPDGTAGSVAIPYPSCDGLLTLTRQGEQEACVTVEVKGQSQAKGNLEVAGIDGGSYRMVFECQS